ncbi:DNA repair protein recA homolog 1, chloroplastic [Linum grandiflorum]
MHSPSPLKPRTIHLTYSPKAFPFLPSFLHHDPPPLLLPLHRRSSFGLCSRVATHSAALKKRNSSNSSTLRCELEGKINGSPSPDFDPRFLDRQKALEAAMNDINSSFGKGSVTRLGSAGGALVETFPSGCLTLDFALGGGLPRGRIVEVPKSLSSSKS